jgi:hypothetical protein
MFGISNPPARSHAAIALLAAVTSMAPAAGAQATGALYGPEGVSPDAIKQGVLGSCYFHASIAALAKIAPDTLRNAISSNPEGGYRVRFVEGPEEVVLPADLAYGRAHAFDRSDGDWVLVLMRGYAQRQVRHSLAASIQRSTMIPSYAKPIALSWINSSGMLLVAYDRAIRSVVNQEGIMNKATFRQALAANSAAWESPPPRPGCSAVSSKKKDSSTRWKSPSARTAKSSALTRASARAESRCVSSRPSRAPREPFVTGHDFSRAANRS